MRIKDLFTPTAFSHIVFPQVAFFYGHEEIVPSDFTKRGIWRSFQF